MDIYEEAENLAFAASSRAHGAGSTQFQLGEEVHGREEEVVELARNMLVKDGELHVRLTFVSRGVVQIDT